LAKPGFYLLLRKAAILSRVTQSVVDFFEDVEVVLHILKRTVVGEAMQQLFDGLFCGTHCVEHTTSRFLDDTTSLCAMA
jgi:hypothetical protein